MTMRYGCLIAAAALSVAGVALAQPPAPPVSPAPQEGREEAPTGEQADVSAVAADFRVGMAIRDAGDVPIGRITRVGQTETGSAVVEVDMDGHPVSLSPHILTLDVSGNGATSSMSKAEIVSAAARTSN